MSKEMQAGMPSIISDISRRDAQRPWFREEVCGTWHVTCVEEANDPMCAADGESLYLCLSRLVLSVCRCFSLFVSPCIYLWVTVSACSFLVVVVVL